MTRLLPTIAAGLIIASAVLVALQQSPIPGLDTLPPIPKEPQARKNVFFEYLYPVVEHHNALIAEEREWLLKHADEPNLTWLDEMRLEMLRERYRVDDELPREDAFAVLKRRINVVPPALVLAQAAKESGWGRSRFAQEGNALFGERCYTTGCGLAPKGRANPTFEVESFDTVAASVESYLLNLNTHDRYRKLRVERSRLMREGQPVTGSRLAEFTAPYSERSEKYVKELIALISHNELDDQKPLDN